MDIVYEVAVVGAGVIGSWAAYTLAKSGIKAILLEQFSVGHYRGSSRGFSRITRNAYTEEYYVEMMTEANRLWERMEKETKMKLYVPTGILVFGEKNCQNDLEPVVSSLEKCGISYQRFDGAAANIRYPGLKLPSDFDCVLESDGGILLADKAIKAVQGQFQALGGKLLDNHKVSKIVPGDIITLETSKGKLKAKKVVLASGGWARDMLRELGLIVPLETFVTEVLYWKVNSPGHFTSSNFPTFWFTPSVSPEHDLIYGFPTCEYPGLMKICKRCRGPQITSPDDAESQNQPPVSADHVSHFIAKYFTGVCTTPSVFDNCTFTNTPDLNPVIDRHPYHQNIVLGVGFSGHGFKLAPVIGKLLQELTSDLPPSYNLQHFCLERFGTKTVKSNL